MKTLFSWLFIFCLCGATIPFPCYAKPQKETKAILAYSVYAGGIHALNAQLAITTSPTRYDTTLTAATQGFLKKLANWSGSFSSTGLKTTAAALPIKHISASTWKGETESKTFRYNGHGKFLSYKVTKDGKDETPKDIPANLAKGTMDNLTATLNLMLAMPKAKAQNKSCTSDTLVYDGDRTYRLIFAETKVETLKKSDYNIYDGPTISCTVEVKPEKGKWRKKPRGWLSIQEQGRQKGALPTVWFGQLKEVPGYVVPVKIRVKTDYGTLFMHLTAAKTG